MKLPFAYEKSKSIPSVNIEAVDNEFDSISGTSMDSVSVQMGIETSHFKTEKLSEYAKTLRSRKSITPSTNIAPLMVDTGTKTATIYYRQTTDLMGFTIMSDISWAAYTELRAMSIS